MILITSFMLNLNNKNLYLASPRGFCAGVERAIKIVERSLELFNNKVYVKHEIVHNTHVVSRLKESGAIFVNEIRDGSKTIFATSACPVVPLQTSLYVGVFEKPPL